MRNLKNLNWKIGNGTDAFRYNTTVIENNITYYYKTSTFYLKQKNFGDDAVNEVICSRLLIKLGFDCTKYTLVDTKVSIDNIDYRTYACRSKDYTIGYDSRISLKDLYTIP